MTLWQRLRRSRHTLIIVGGLYDIVWQVPPGDVGRSGVRLRSAGEATLVLELRDSLSNEVVYRAVERRAASRRSRCRARMGIDRHPPVLV